MSAPVVYHGTPRPPFDVFDRLAGSMSARRDTIDKAGIWFTASLDDARKFAGSQGHVVAAMIDVRNPLVVQGFEGLSGFGRAHGLHRPDKAEDAIHRHLPGETFRALLIELGYDGIRIMEGGAGDFRESVSDYWIALDDAQITRVPLPSFDSTSEPAPEDLPSMPSP
jgi:hypothetical protein